MKSALYFGAGILMLASCSVTMPTGSVSENGMITQGEVNGSLSGSSFIFNVVGTDTTCSGTSLPSGVSSGSCSDGTTLSYSFPAEKYGQMNSWYYSETGNGAGPTVSGWGRYSDINVLEDLLAMCIADPTLGECQ